MQKPITLIRKELTEEIVESINKSGLPLLIIEPILQNLLDSVRGGIRAQEEKDAAEYGEYLQKQKEAAQGDSVPPETEG